MPQMPRIRDLQTGKTSPIIGDNPPQPKIEILLDAARETMARPDPLRGSEVARSVADTVFLLTLIHNQK